LHGKEALATTFLDAEPDAILKMPEDSPAPFLVTIAMSVFFTALLMKLAWLAIAAALVIFLSLLVWLWPERRLGQRAGAAA
jgi:cytochrome c oxidase subunit 1/cytochrome c oxidase subunit I+III